MGWTYSFELPRTGELHSDLAWQERERLDKAFRVKAEWAGGGQWELALMVSARSQRARLVEGRGVCQRGYAVTDPEDGTRLFVKTTKQEQRIVSWCVRVSRKGIRTSLGHPYKPKEGEEMFSNQSSNRRARTSHGNAPAIPPATRCVPNGIFCFVGVDDLSLEGGGGLVGVTVVADMVPQYD
jgi:hypothetical protein